MDVCTCAECRSDLDLTRCEWGRHYVQVEDVVGELHGLVACSDCWQEHDESCCDRCARVGICPQHGRDLAACKAEAAARDLEAEWRAD
jgi:hypothetical protein